ncbi:MAG: NTP transferase domain-containing protein [Actinomycetota bacterium]
MARVRATILAAGRGVRMGGGTPKTLLPVDEGKGPLLRYILEGLQKAAVTDLLVVTGHRAAEVETYVRERWDEDNLTFVRNMRYASWGNFHTVRVALDQSPGMDMLVVNSDIVVHPDVYRRVIDQRGDLILAVQRRQRLDDEDMRVHLKGNRVLGVSKSLPVVKSQGEYAGVSLLRDSAHRIYGDLCNARQWRAQTRGYYEDVYNDMVNLVEARAAEVAAGEYAEVDKPEDLPGAAAVIERHF